MSAAQPLAYIINCSFTYGTPLQALKIAGLGQGDVDNFMNYKPISVLPYIFSLKNDVRALQETMLSYPLNVVSKTVIPLCSLVSTQDRITAAMERNK